MNAVTSNDIMKLVINKNGAFQPDTYFKYKVSTKGITDQKKSGRCWLYTGLNVIRPGVIEEYSLTSFNFSHTYSFFFDQLEKANLFMEGIIATVEKPMDDRKVEWLFKNPIGDGGQWTGVVDIVEKYGLVPAEIMPETSNSSNTRIMSRLLGRKLREAGIEMRNMYTNNKKTNFRAYKEEVLSDIYQILVICLGKPPASFEWRYEDESGNISELKTYTPVSFYKEFVKTDLNEYVMFMDDPSREYYRLYEIENDRHMLEGNNWKYINLPSDEIKKFAALSIIDNEPMYFSCDVGKQLNSDKGYLDLKNYDFESLFGITFEMDKKERIQTFESGSSHGMSLMGVDTDKNGKPVKWLLENSWGEKSGYKGYLIMTDEWFNEYMFRLVIHKRYLAESVLEILEQKPILLPPWDPMFVPEP